MTLAKCEVSILSCRVVNPCEVSEEKTKVNNEVSEEKTKVSSVTLTKQLFMNNVVVDA